MNINFFKSPWFLLVALVLYIAFDLAAQSLVFLDVFGLSPELSLGKRMLINPQVSLFVIVSHLCMFVLGARGEDGSRMYIALGVAFIHGWFAYSQTPFQSLSQFTMQVLYALPGALWACMAGAMYYWLTGGFMEELRKISTEEEGRKGLEKMILDAESRGKDLDEKGKGLEREWKEMERMREEMERDREILETSIQNAERDKREAERQREKAEKYETLYQEGLAWIVELQEWTQDRKNAGRSLRNETKR